MKFRPTEMASCNDWMIGIDEVDWLNGNQFCSSFHVLEARLFEMTYPDYLRYLRANGAELRGKQGYTVAAFKNKADCQKICTMLNKEWGVIEPVLKARGV